MAQQHLIKDKAVDSKNSVQLSESCFSVCEALNTTIYGGGADGLDESMRIALENSEKYVY